MARGFEELEAAREECVNYNPREDADLQDYTDPVCWNFWNPKGLKVEGIYWCGICGNRTTGESLFDKEKEKLK